jgi:hypothetical protein
MDLGRDRIVADDLQAVLIQWGNANGWLLNRGWGRWKYMDTPHSIQREIIHQCTVQLHNDLSWKSHGAWDAAGQQGRIDRIHSTGTFPPGDLNREGFIS